MGNRPRLLAVCAAIAAAMAVVCCEPRNDGSTHATADSGPGGAIASIEFGRTMFGSDFAVRSDVPQSGTLFSVWTKVPEETPTYPYTRGNMDAYVLYGDGWHLRFPVGNLVVQSSTNALYNANSMLFAGASATWVDDYSYYVDTTPRPEAQARGWVWAAWQVVVQSDAFVIRQWLKFGLEGSVFAAGESNPTFAQMRDRLVNDRGWSRVQADAWIPGGAVSFQVGKDAGYLCHARMSERSTVPSLGELDAIARAQTADPSAWADYELAWVGGAASLADRSGHGRDLTIAPGGQLHPGPESPAF